jgi:hypothetical protein
MKNRRSLALGALAFYPLIVLVLLTFVPEAPFAAPEEAGDLWSFWAKWWFALFGVTVFAIIILFSVHALRRTGLSWWRRGLWLAGFWSFGPVVLPAYWWAESHAA